jgi:HSP20 family protein
MVPTIRKNQNWLPSIFNDFFDYDGLNINRLVHNHTPAINVIETDKEYKVELAAPGMSKEDFKISVNDNHLVVSMEKKGEHKEDGKEGKYLRREFSYSKYEHKLLLPENIMEDKIEARMKHGVLHIEIPKDHKDPAPSKQRMIEIK